MDSYPHDLRRCILLSLACVVAFDADDYKNARRLMKERDALYLKLSACDAFVFGEWAFHRMPPEIETLLLVGHSAGTVHDAQSSRWN